MLITKLALCASVLLMGNPEAKANEPKSEQQSQQATAAQADQNTDANAEQPELKVEQIDGVKLWAIEAHIVSYTNEERSRYGLPPLEVDPELMDTAREHASWMTRNHSMVHTSRPVAENIAMGQPHSSDAVRAWMNSSGHRANILNGGHRRIGVAAFRTEGGTIFWCQQFRP